MKVLYGYDIPKDLYPKIAELDSDVFSADASDFSGDTTMPKETIIELLEKNITMTTIVVDDNNDVIGYYQAFPMESKFEQQYINGEVGFKDINADSLLDSSVTQINMYLWTMAIRADYRGVKIDDPKMPGNKVAVIQLLQEGLVDCLVDLKKQGVTVEKVFGEGVSEKGVEIAKSFCGEDSLIHADEENGFYMFGADFDVNCKAFERCRNVEKLKLAYASKAMAKKNVLSEDLISLKDDSHMNGQLLTGE